MIKLQLHVIGRENCHLCHDMLADLRLFQIKFDFDVVWLDIEDDAALQGRWAMKIPVLLDETGNELCFGRLDSVVLNQWLLSRRVLTNDE